MNHDNHNAMYEAFKSKDSRFDGHFFVGVSSTGIYCRPVCKARLPKSENCTYYSSAAAAEQAGYRPCLLCRPELAPGNNNVAFSSTLAHRMGQIIQESCGNDQKMSDIALLLGFSERHLRRTFVAEYGVSPVQYLQTTRLLLAKSLLTDTNLSILDVAMTSGFNSLRRFNDAFKKHYRLTPSGLRKEASNAVTTKDTITIYLGYRPPYCWDTLIKFLDARAIPGVEKVENNEYYRTVQYLVNKNKKVSGCIKVSHKFAKNALAVTIDVSLLPGLSYILARVRALFDTECNPTLIYEKISSMNEIKADLCTLGTRLPGCFDSFEMSIRAILGQQITIKAAKTLIGRFVETYGTPIKSNVEGLTHIFPTTDIILNLGGKLDFLGITRAQSQTIYALASFFNTNDFNQILNPEDEVRRLREISGIDECSANYIAMRAFGWTDAFLHTDLKVKKALNCLNEKELLEVSQKWSPWRSYVTINLWNSLEQEE